MRGWEDERVMTICSIAPEHFHSQAESLTAHCIHTYTQRMLYAMCVYVEQAVPGKGITQFTIVDVLRVVHTH